MTHEETCWRLAELRGCKPTDEQLKRAIELDDKEEMSDAKDLVKGQARLDVSCTNGN